MKRRHLSTEERIWGDGGGGASGGGDPRVAVKVASRHPEPGWESPAPPLLDLDCGLRTLNEQSLLLKPPALLRSREEALGEGAQCPGHGCGVPGLDSFHVAGTEGPAGGRRASAGASGLGSPACPLPLASGPGGSQEGAAAGTIARIAATWGGPRPRPPALAAGVGGAVLPTAGPELPASALSRRPHGSRGGRPATSGTRSYTSAQPRLSRPGPGSASEGAPRGRVAPWPPCGHSAMSPHRCCVRSPVAPAPAVPVTRVRAQTLRTGITPPMSADRAPGPQAPARPDCHLCHRVLEQVVRQPLSPGQPVARPRPSPGSL